MNRRRFLTALAALAAVPAALAGAKGVQASGPKPHVRIAGAMFTEPIALSGGVQWELENCTFYDAAALRADQERRAAEAAGRAFPRGPSEYLEFTIGNRRYTVPVYDTGTEA